MGGAMSDSLFDVSGRTVLFAGGAGGLGSALALAFAKRGARAAIADMDEGKAKRLAASLPGPGHFGFGLDVRRDESCKQAVATVLGQFGRLDVLFNCGGVIFLGSSLTLPAEQFEQSMAANTTGVFLMSRAAARAMIDAGGGRIITLASVSSTVANPNYAAYAASKSALIGLTRVLALEYARNNVTVNAIGPAVIRTPMSEKFLEDETYARTALGKIPMGRLGQPEDIIGAAILLASAAGDFITGQTIYVDGGRTLS
ncbi:MAG: SDR family oxidoreductase [Rhodospirillales bacterium]|nr:SDR family oxidoreductase [Rhodospirillales bacterium]